MESFLEYLKKRVRLTDCQYMTYDELAEWPTEQVDEAKEDGCLRQVNDADGVICRECPEHCWKDVEIREKADRKIGVFHCEDEDCGGLMTVELERLQQWEIVIEQPKTDDTQDITIGEGFMSSTQLAKLHGLDPENLRKRLERCRGKCALDSDLFVESQDRGNRKPKYLYDPQRVDHIIQSMKSKTSAKRPPK